MMDIIFVEPEETDQTVQMRRLRFCSIHNECVRLLPVGAALKLRIEYEWVIPDENIPVFTLFTEGATYHSVSLNSSFQWPRLQSFNLLHEPGPQLVVSIPNCWSLLSCVTGADK